MSRNDIGSAVKAFFLEYSAEVLARLTTAALSQGRSPVSALFDAFPKRGESGKPPLAWFKDWSTIGEWAKRLLTLGKGASEEQVAKALEDAAAATIEKQVLLSQENGLAHLDHCRFKPFPRKQKGRDGKDSGPAVQPEVRTFGQYLADQGGYLPCPHCFYGTGIEIAKSASGASKEPKKDEKKPAEFRSGAEALQGMSPEDWLVINRHRGELSEDQFVKFIEAFDEANTVMERQGVIESLRNMPNLASRPKVWEAVLKSLRDRNPLNMAKDLVEAIADGLDSADSTLWRAALKVHGYTDALDRQVASFVTSFDPFGPRQAPRLQKKSFWSRLFGGGLFSARSAAELEDIGVESTPVKAETNPNIR